MNGKDLILLAVVGGGVMYLASIIKKMPLKNIFV